MKIKILNPQPGGFTHVGLSRAERHIRQGRAEWVDLEKSAIRFIESHHQRRAATVKASLPGAGGYDRSAHLGAIASDKQMVGVPIINPRDLIAPRRRFVRRPQLMSAAAVNGTR